MATTCEVNVKWGKEKYTVTIDLTQPPTVFKAQLYSLTKVPVERQKSNKKKNLANQHVTFITIFCFVLHIFFLLVSGFRGGLLKDDGDWAKIQPRNKQQVMLIGAAEDATATATSAATVDRPSDLHVKFFEDLSPEDQAAAIASANGGSAARCGLVNIGNTCYMNAVLEALRASPELVADAAKYAGPSILAKALGSTYADLDKSVRAVSPYIFWAALCKANPEFGQKSEMGMNKQHDADECMTTIMAELAAARLPAARLFEGEMCTRRHCLEGDAAMGEAESVSKDVFRKLECHIDGKTSFLMPALKEGLSGSMEKFSSVLGRNALYSTESRVSRLPYYLTVQFVRFYWKAAINDRAKIVRPVQFPANLDVLDICSPELAARLKAVRAYQRAREELTGNAGGDSAAAEKAVAEAPKDVVAAAESTELENNSGFYELAAIVSHIGMSANGGHYVAWVKEKEGWFKYDDDKVSPVSETDVAKVDGRGGGDWHVAYLVIYRTKRNKLTK